jgi:hypothetical protein
MLIAAPPELLPPFPFGNGLLHRLRVVVVRHGEVPDLPPSRVIGELPQLEANAMARTDSRPLRHSRRLKGEILCDGAGRLYEKIGHFVQPIHQLVAGPAGEVLDIAPPQAALSRGHGAVATDAVDATVIDIDAGSVKHAETNESRETKVAGEPTHAASWRAISDPRSRVVCFGEFRAVLGSQLANPKRLRDAHRLSCRVHVYESFRKQRIETLAVEVSGCAAAHCLPLTPAVAARLDLTDLLPRRRVPPTNREAGVMFPGDRVVQLEVLIDPTAALPESEGAPREMTAGSAPAAAAVDVPRGRRTSIPERFLVPWQFAISRDEAIYDVNLEATRPRLRSWFARLWAAAARRGELKKWQALLHGRTLDDQLWAVRPPADSVSNPVIRDWARRMLEAAGYDPATMMFEWDVYWRRKRG